MHGTIASGHKLTSQAAAHALKKGGNAFDAIVAAKFASFITEPMLTTLAGGGIGLIRTADGKTKSLDFVVEYPGLERKTDKKPIPVKVNFGDETQIFRIGYPSIATPGTFHGLLHIHKKYCTLELKDIVEPAIEYSRDGVVLNRLQAFIVEILGSMCTYTQESREIFAPEGKLLKEGETVKDVKFAEFLERVADDSAQAMDEYIEKIVETTEGKDCSIGLKDLKHYKVHESDPISIDYRGNEIFTVAPPSAGGILVAYALKIMENEDLSKYKHNSADYLVKLTEVMKKANKERTQRFFKNLIYKDGFWKEFLSKNRLGGTTHVSVMDKEGNIAGITSSNGQGCGVMVGDTGVMLNNFLGEDDLMQYEAVYKPGHRFTTMMSPTIIMKDENPYAILGSGGSNRIRSAILQTILNLVDFKMGPDEACNAARVHFEDDVLQVEPGVSSPDKKTLKEKYKTNEWSEKNLFFGGVHVAMEGKGGGDKRRGGNVLVV